jgi:hypothetical protein
MLYYRSWERVGISRERLGTLEGRCGRLTIVPALGLGCLGMSRAMATSVPRALVSWTAKMEADNVEAG